MRAGVGNSSLVHSPFVACLPVLPQHSSLMLIMLSKGRKNNNNERAENERE